MGWWSENIMGGDEALDFFDEMLDILGIDDTDIIPKKKFDVEKILFYFKNKHYYSKLNSNWNWMENTDEGNIFYQVLGLQMMLSGVIIPDDLKEKIIKAAEKDEWATDNDERKEEMNRFIKNIKNYNGKPLIVNSKKLTELGNNVNSDTVKDLILIHVEKHRRKNVNNLLDQLIDIVSKQEYRA